MAVYQVILQSDALGRNWRATVLRDAVAAALTAGDSKQADAWKTELAESAAAPLTEGKP